jgi:hypothetical protein
MAQEVALAQLNASMTKDVVCRAGIVTYRASDPSI